MALCIYLIVKRCYLFDYKSVRSTSDISVSSTPVISPPCNFYLLLHVCDVPVSGNLLCHIHKMSPTPL